MNRIHVAPPVALALLVLLAGCKAAAPPEDFPQAAADAWLGSFNGGDVAGLVLSYTADAKLLPPDEPPIVGSRGRSRRSGRPIARARCASSRATWSRRRLGELWFREGAYKAQFADEGEPRVGKFIELWKQENGNWLMYRQIWNRNAPLAPGAPPEDTPADEPA